MALFSIDFACNDPDNGEFAGRVGMACVSWYRTQMDLDLDPFGGVKFTELNGGEAIRIHRQVFKVHSVKGWVGNWCWNRYWLTYREYRRLVRVLAVHGWKCTAGLARWGDAYERRAALAKVKP